MWLILFMVVILQSHSKWQELKHCIDLAIKPDMMCVQESWLKPHLDFVIQGYVIILEYGGCPTLVKQDKPYRV